MVLPLALAAALSAAPAPPAPAAVPPTLRLDQEEWEEGAESYEEPRRPRIRLTAWGGESFASAGNGRGSGFGGVELGWAFHRLDLGVLASEYRDVEDAKREWTPVILARVTQRFETRRGVEAAIGLGFGAGRVDGWSAWYQVTFGVRVPLGPLFLAGELGFERDDLLRLAAGLGVAFF